MKTLSSSDSSYLAKRQKTNINATDRASLIRKANRLYNEGDRELSKKIYMTLGYPNGLIRVAHHHEEQGDVLEAYRLYVMAGKNYKSEELSKKLAEIIRTILSEDTQDT